MRRDDSLRFLMDEKVLPAHFPQHAIQYSVGIISNRGKINRSSEEYNAEKSVSIARGASGRPGALLFDSISEKPDSSQSRGAFLLT